jgi:thiol-disulfide isomerase/thioredoxin
MTLKSLRTWGLLTLGTTLVAATAALADGRPAETILREYNAIVIAGADASKGKGRSAELDLRTKRAKALNRRSELALELYRAEPDHPQVAKLLAARWEHRLDDSKKAGEVKLEVDNVLSKSKNADLLTEASFTKANLALLKNSRNPEAAMPAIDDFIQRSPKDERGATLLHRVASQMVSTDRQTKILARLAEAYPDSPYAGEIKEIREAAAANRGSPEEAVGKPFNLEFVDAISGNKVSTRNLKGKVIVVDFWATWCGPCVAELPKMKALYAEYRSKGVEFIGVSLDQPQSEGGYDKLVEFVGSNGINWPQYYQGNGWKSEFSKAWGINSIPAVFFVDADGKLVTTKARGKLEQLIPEYLVKAKKNRRP